MILADYYNIFSNYADSYLPGWRDLSKDDLLRGCVKYENEGTLGQGYVSASFCKYWPAISKYIVKSGKSACPEDCFEWLTHAFLYTVEHRKWLDENSPMFTDPNAPDKIMNRCIISTRHIFYQAANNDNRKINFGLESLDNLEEENLSYIIPGDSTSERNFIDSLHVKDLVISRIEKEKYVQAAIIDGITNGNVFTFDKDSNQTFFNKKRLAKHLRYVDDIYAEIFSKNYNITEELSKQIFASVKELSSSRLYKIIDQTLYGLKKEYTEEFEM